MPKKLSAKTQEIKPKLPPSAAKFADTSTIEPEEKELESKKGIIYVVYSLKDKTNYETDLLTRLIEDTLRQSYYLSDNASPIQALEKAISDVKENIFRLKENEEEPAQLNLIAAILWGNIFYVVRNGSGEVHVLREGEFKKIDLVKEGRFSVATGVVQKDDVVVLSTEEFAQKFPPKKLLKLAPEELENLAEEESCLMIKFDLEEGTEEDKVENFGKPRTKRNALKKGAEKVKAMVKKNKRKNKKETKTEGVTELQIRKKNKTNKKWVAAGITTAITIALIISVGTGLKGRVYKKPEDSTEQKVETAENAQEVEETGEEDNTTDTGQTSNAEAFYDIKIANAGADPLRLEYIDGKIYAADSSGILYVSQETTPKFEQLPLAAFSGFREIESKDGKVYIGTDSGYSIYDPETESTENYETQSSEVFFPYLSSVYEARGTQILKLTLAEETEEAVWAESDEFSNVRDMAISISIYLLTDSGDIIRYTSGTKEDFAISGLETAFNNPTVLKTKWDWDNMYIVDKGNNRIVSVTKEGEFVNEYIDSRWTDLRDIAVNLEESTAYILSGSKVFQLEL